MCDVFHHSAELPCEGVIQNHCVERDLIHRILCRELVITLWALDPVLCVIVLDSCQQVAVK